MLRRLIEGFAVRSEHLVLAAMLLVLHLALWADPGSALSRSLMLAHLGLFLIWQPIWSRDRRLAPSTMAAFLGLTAAGILWLSWWVAACWLVLLIGLVGGRTLNSRNARSAYMLTLVLLVSELLIRCVPQAFGVTSIAPGVELLFRFGLALIPALIVVLRFPAERGVVDFFRGITIALLVAMLALGGLLNMYHRGAPYPVALLQSLLALAAFLFLISWLLSPHRGFRGFAQLWERSLLNIGTPFETWLGELAEFAERQQTPERFLDEAMTALARLPWVEALAWEAPDARGRIGEPTAHDIELPLPDLRVHLYTRRPVGPTLLLHCKLLLQLVGHFYLAKVRERELAQRAHLQAIYETGARVTHDIKNLLQSLHTMTAALERDRLSASADHEGQRDGGRAQRLFERQIPHLTRRLQLALDKLQAPRSAAADERPAQAWLQAARERHQSLAVRWEARLQRDPPVPVELFDSVLDNLLENARLKQQAEPRVAITVQLDAPDGDARLRVCDSGTPVPPDKAALLLRQPLDSEQGLGIGLYQAARQARMSGYALTLADNAPGHVVFELRREPTRSA